MRSAVCIAALFANESMAADTQAPAGASAGRSPRVVIITTKECPQCDALVARLERKGGAFEAMRARGWVIGAGANSHLQVVDRDDAGEIVELLKTSSYPAVAAVERGEIVRSFQSGCTTPLDAWTFGWLATGVNRRPRLAPAEPIRVDTTGHYPLRGNHWTIDGDSSPTRETVLGHLRGSNHAHQAARYATLDAWSYEELRSLHDNLHELEMGGVSGPSRPKRTDTMSAVRKSLGRT